MKSSNQLLHLTFSYKSIFLLIISSFMCFIGTITFIFNSFKKDLESVKKALEETTIETSTIIKQLTLENVSQSQKISKLEQEILFSTKSFQTSSSIFEPELLKLLMYALAAIVGVIALYYTYNWFFQKTIIGKIIGFTNYYACLGFEKLTGTLGTHTKIHDIDFSEHNFALKITIDSEKSRCFVSYKFGSDQAYIPFERFLELHQALIDLGSIKNAVTNGDLAAISDAASLVIASNPTALRGIEGINSLCIE